MVEGVTIATLLVAVISELPAVDIECSGGDNGIFLQMHATGNDFG